MDINRWQELEQEGNTSNINYIKYSDGNVGIGTLFPRATLDIYTQNSSINSIKVNNNIWAQTGIISSSDIRIKKDIVNIDDGEALNKILSIKPMIYDYIDNYRYQNKKDVHGFIAQQIATVIPEAISLQTEAVPNIYCFATIYNNILMINDDVPNIDDILKEGVQVALSYNKCNYIITIDEIYSFNVYNIINDYNINGNVFVYGTVVTDFHSLDKNYLFTINVCAVQDLYRKQQKMYSNLENLKESYQLNTLDKVDENINTTKHNISNLAIIKDDVLAKYAMISTEYNELNSIQSNYMSTIVGKIDIDSMYNCISTLKSENARIYAENTSILSNNQILKNKLNDVVAKVNNIRKMLQNKNFI